jgi:hypothetical protein
MHDLLLNLKIYKHFADRIEQSESKEIPEEDVLHDLAQLFPNERPKNLFKTFVGWARYSELFSYEPNRAILKMFEKSYLGKPPASRLKEAGA